ncbi:major facilitator superfamily domain-containing protein [Cercophora newfieldiana]|uniref:Major facilitator superfamily domain-containing protein n=1 Tax=Cercophora newfieldiana TaxID=92897 RepID=A0AA40CUQ5_9PEZI|nr:major facilitator superfamily domain-containing protein [Cercophora newfieldiana]
MAINSDAYNPPFLEHYEGKQVSQEDDLYPEGGLRAWLVAAGAACILFATLGWANSFGVFFPFYLNHQLSAESPDSIAWIGSVQVTLSFATGVVGGPLFDRYGTLVLRPATAAYIFAVMVTSLCEKYWQFMLAQGVLTGIAMGFLLSPSMAAVSQHFHRRRGAAMGIAIAGSSIGSVVFPIMLSKLLNETNIGFGWSVRIAGFIMLPVLGFSVLTIKTRLEPRKTQFFLPEAFKSRLYLALIAATFFLFIGTFIPLFYISTYAISRGMNNTLAGYLVAILNGAGVPGRIIPGIMGDKLGRLNALCAAGVATAVLIFCWPTAVSDAAIIVFSVAIGFTSGAIISGASVAITLCASNPKDVGTWLGQALAIASLAALGGGPANGALVKAYDSFDQVSYLSGSACMFGAALVLAAKACTPEGLFGRV